MSKFIGPSVIKSILNSLIADKLLLTNEFVNYFGRDIKNEGNREAKILKMHYGLDGSKKPVTLRDIGTEMGLTRERIRQLLRGALTKLYECMEN